MDKSCVGLLLLLLMLHAQPCMSVLPQQLNAIQRAFIDNKLQYSLKFYDVTKENDRNELVAMGIGAHSSRNARWELGNLKLLPKQARERDPPPKWNIHVIENGIWTIAILTRSDNLYLCGYWTEMTGWRELNSHFIPDSEMLHFGGSYTDLNGGRKNLTSLPLGINSLGNAVITLATTTNELEVRGALTVLVVMLCETQRFTAIRDCVLGGWDGDTCRLTEKDVAFLVKFGELSCALLEGWPNDPNDMMYKDLIKLMEKYHVTKEDVPGMLVVLLRGYACKDSMVGITRIKPPRKIGS